MKKDNPETSDAVLPNNITYQQLVETMNDGLVVLDNNGWITYVNDKYCAMFGYLREELLGGRVTDLLDEANRQILQAQLATRAAGGQQDYELAVTHKNGRQVPVLISPRPMFDNAGQPQGSFAVLVDITERKQVEETLRQNETLLRTVIDATPDWIFIKDQQHRYRLVNRSYAEALHLTPEDFIGKHELELGFPEDIVKGNPAQGIRGFWADDREVMDNDRLLANPHVPVIIDGQIHIFDDRKLPLHDAAGQVWGVLGIGRDVTEREQNRQVLTQRATQLEMVAEVSAATSTILEADKLLWQVANLTKERFGLYHAHIYLLNEAGDTLKLAAGAGEVGQKMVAQSWHIPLEQERSLVARAARARQGVIENNVQQALDWLPNPLLPHTQAELAAPITVGERVLGVLDVQSDKLGYFTQEDVHIQTILAAQVGVALHNARLYAQTIQRAAELEALGQVSRRLSAVLDPHQLVTEVVEQVRLAFHYYYVQIYLFDQTQANLVLTAGSGDVGRQLLARQHSLPSGRGLVGRAAAQNKVFFIPDVQRHVGVEVITPANVAAVYRREADPAIETEWYAQLIERYFGSRQALAGTVNRAGKTIKIGYVAHIPGIFPAMLQRGVAAAARDLAVEAIFVMPEHEGEHLPLFEALVQQQVDGLVVIPDHPRWVEAIKQAQAAGIPVVTANRDLDRSPGDMHVGLDNFQAGIMLARELLKLLETANTQTGTILISTGVPDRNAGVKYALHATQYTLIDVEGYIEDEDFLKTHWAEAIQRQPNLIGVLSSTVTESPILAEIKGRIQGQWLIIGFDLDLATLAAIKENVVQVTLGQHPYLQGYLPVMALAEHIGLGKPLAGWIAEGWLGNPLLPETQTEIAVPITIGAAVLGVLDVQHNIPGGLTADNVKLLRAVADQVAVGLRNATLFDEVQQSGALLDKRIKELNCLNEIGREMIENPPVDQLLQWAAGRIPPAMQYPALCRVAIELEGQIYGQADAVTLRQQMTHGLRIGGNIIGHIYVAYTEKYDFLNEESALLGGIANRVSGYIETIRLIQQTQHRAQREQMLREVTARIRGSTDVDTVMRTAVQEVGRALGRQTFVYLGSQPNGPTTSLSGKVDNSAKGPAAAPSTAAPPIVEPSTVEPSTPNPVEKEGQHE